MAIKDSKSSESFIGFSLPRYYNSGEKTYLAIGVKGMNTRVRVIRMCLFVIPVMYLPFFSGCKVGPDYVRPESSVPDQWHEKAVQGLADGSADLQTWWTVFDDPMLEDLIGRSRAENLDLQIAAVRIMEARALLGVASGEYWPNVDAAGFYSRDRVSENGLIAPPSGDVDETNLNLIGVDATCEIDVFGRISRSVESAQASMQASVEDYRDVLVSLYSEVAQSYIDLRATQTRLKYTVNNAELQRDTLKLTQDRREAGLVPQLDVEQAKLILASTESAIPRLQELESLTIHRLSVLLGQPPAALYDELSTAADVPDVPEEIAASLPAELLRLFKELQNQNKVIEWRTTQVMIQG